MNKKWAEDYSSDEGEPEGHEEDLVSDNEDNGQTSLPAQQEDDTQFIAYITNLHFSAQREAIGLHFEDLGCNISKLDLGQGYQGKSNGTAVIQFLDQESLDICLGANGSELIGRRITTSLSENITERKYSGHGSDHRNDRQHDKNDRYNRERVQRDGGRREYRQHDIRQDNHQDNRQDNRQGNRQDNRQDNRQGNRYDDRREPRHDRNDRNDPRHEGSRPQDARSGRQTEQRVQSRGVPFTKSTEKSDAPTPAAEPLTRPKLELKPRTLPLEDVGRPAVKSAIFGEGHASDVAAYERNKEKVAPVAGSAPSSTNVEVSSLPVKDNSSYEVIPPAPPVNEVNAHPRNSRATPKEGSKPSIRSKGNTKAPPAQSVVDKVAVEDGLNSELSAQKNANREKSGGNSQTARIFNSAVNQTKKPTWEGKDKDQRKPRVEKEESQPKVPTLTDEEKFQRAQQTIAKAESTVSKVVKQKTGGFAVLGDDESEDD